MKTTKLSYCVEYQERDASWHSVECVTLAEARLISSRYIHAIIKPVGKIEYWSGIERDDISYNDAIKRYFN